MAQTGELFTALNDQEYTLSDKDLVIADDEKILALAGIIGGKTSAVSSQTTRVIFECATFDATTIRLTAQRFGLRTDASTRYEKSFDPYLTRVALARIGDYLDFLGKDTTVYAGFSYLSPSAHRDIRITLTHQWLSAKIGCIISQDHVQTILTNLGFTVSVSEDTYTVTVPSWRATKDVSIAEDIAEEVARVWGYDRIDAVPMIDQIVPPRENIARSLRHIVADALRSTGYTEVYNYSFSSATHDARIGLMNMDGAIAIKNAFNVEYTHMRRSLIPHLLKNTSDNRRLASSLRFFEI